MNSHIKKKFKKLTSINGHVVKPVIIDNEWSGYYISNDGILFSVKKNIIKIMKTRLDKDGYIVTCLSLDGRLKYISIHTLVAKAFLYKYYSKGKVVNHKDGDKTNNNYTNLEWVTQKRNVEHAFEIGLSGVGDKSNNHKLTSTEVKKICELLEKTNMTYKEICNVIG